MKCQQCSACCIAHSISSKILGMPNGKPANISCVNLDNNNLCKIFDSPKRPSVCSSFKPDIEFCESSLEEATKLSNSLE